MTPAWAEPSPGRKETRLDDTTLKLRDLKRSFLFIFVFLRDCLGIFTSWKKLRVNREVPKSPVNKGNKGCLITEKFKTAYPRMPARIKINAARILWFFFSFRIKKRDREIKRKAIILDRAG